MKKAVDLFTDLQCRTLGTLLRGMAIEAYVVVDNNSLDNKLLKTRFEACGKRLRVVETRIPRWVREGCPMPIDLDSTLVFVDLQIPGTDGREVARELRRQSALVVLVALTASRPLDTDTLFQLFDGVILKPVSLKNLEELLAGGRA